MQKSFKLNSNCVIQRENKNILSLQLILSDLFTFKSIQVLSIFLNDYVEQINTIGKKIIL